MSRGPTRRVRRLIANGAVTDELLVTADHEADLLAHPYIGPEHLQLARLRLPGHEKDLATARARTVPGVPSRRWRPRGRKSALRRRGLAQTRDAQQRAQREDGDR